jgi:hypothetical protein
MDLRTPTNVNKLAAMRFFKIKVVVTKKKVSINFPLLVSSP